MLRLAVLGFVDAVEAGRAPSPSVEDGERAHILAEAAYKSLRGGGVVRVDEFAWAPRTGGSARPRGKLANACVRLRALSACKRLLGGFTGAGIEMDRLT
jgi:hypothetical protein